MVAMHLSWCDDQPLRANKLLKMRGANWVAGRVLMPSKVERYANEREGVAK
jgi:hypothetical protein